MEDPPIEISHDFFRLGGYQHGTVHLRHMA